MAHRMAPLTRIASHCDSAQRLWPNSAMSDGACVEHVLLSTLLTHQACTFDQTLAVRVKYFC